MAMAIAQQKKGLDLGAPPRGNWRLLQNRIYALAILDAENPAKIFPEADAAEVAFHFSVNPRSLSMDEPPAVVIQPTQAGQYVEHSGQIFKNITLSGTTGLRPNQKGGPRAILDVRLPQFAQTPPDPVTGLPVGERTGFDDLIALRNIFRAYYEAKKDPARAGSTILVWQNGKEGEYYVVEPVGSGFRTIREASSRTTASYEINLRTIERYEASRLIVPTGPAAALGFLQRIARLTTDIRASFTFVQSLIGRATGIAQAAVTTVLGPFDAVVRGLAGVVGAGARAIGMPRSLIANLFDSVKSLATSLDALPSQVNAYKTDNVITQAASLSHEFKKSLRLLAAVQRERALFAKPMPALLSDRSRRYSQPPRAGVAPHAADLRSSAVPVGAREAVVNQGDTIRTIARRLLGDAARWKEIVLLNNLRPPYISTDGDGRTILRPLDRILAPAPPEDGGEDLGVSARETPWRRSSARDERLGVDFQLTRRDAYLGTGAFDVLAGSDGDVAKVRGQDNMNQAIHLLLGTEPGELPAHPTRGTLLPVGSRIRAVSHVQMQVAIRSGLLGDARVAGIPALSIVFEGGVSRVSGFVSLVGSDSALGFNEAVRR